MQKGNKGEWSELYAFIKLLKDGRVYAADENVEKLENIYFPIIKLIREETANDSTDYFTGKQIKIFQNGDLIETINATDLVDSIDTLYEKIFNGSKNNSSGAFSIEEAEDIMNHLHITKIKAPSTDKLSTNSCADLVSYLTASTSSRLTDPCSMLPPCAILIA